MAEEQDQPRPTEVTTSPGPGSVVESAVGEEAERRTTRRTLHEILLETWQDPEELEFITEHTKIGFLEEFVHDILVVIFGISDLSAICARTKTEELADERQPELRKE